VRAYLFIFIWFWKQDYWF